MIANLKNGTKIGILKGKNEKEIEEIKKAIEEKMKINLFLIDCD